MLTGTACRTYLRVGCCQHFTRLNARDNFKIRLSAAHVGMYASCGQGIPKILNRNICCTPFACNHYERLGLNRDAKGPDIKKAYIKMTKKYHPDAKEDSDDFDEFLKIAEAYEILSNPSSRRQYDFQQFGNSSDLNRFEMGEYETPRDAELRKTRLRQQRERPRPEIDNTIKLALTPEMRKILDYLLGVLFATIIAMWAISHYQNKGKEDKDDGS